MPHGAIETEYKGYRFRSRLEARWAVFFDALRIEWKYETEGYEVDGARYLPDFFLPASNDWVEVKGDPKGLLSAIGRMRTVLGENSPLPGFAAGKASLLILGELPTATSGTVLHQCYTRRGVAVRTAGLSRRWFFFGPKGDTWMPLAIEPSIVLALFGRQFGTGAVDMTIEDDWVVRHEVLPTAVHFGPAFDAYRAARHARFEHGERGR